jgi:hypothetical protein
MKTVKKERLDYKLPNGKVTVDAKKYIAAWKKIARPIEKITGMKMDGFDPSISFYDPKKQNKFIQLPVWFIVDVNKAFQEAKANSKTKYVFVDQNRNI